MRREKRKRREGKSARGSTYIRRNLWEKVEKESCRGCGGVKVVRNGEQEEEAKRERGEGGREGRREVGEGVRAGGETSEEKLQVE